MKQNAAGLANICILSTMVLVMISSTVAMYTGMEDILNERFPRECIVEAYEPTEENITFVNKKLEEIFKKHHVTSKNEVKYSYTGTPIVRNGNELTYDQTKINAHSDYGTVYLITEEEYNQLEGKNVELQDDQVLTYGTKDQFEEKKILLNGKTYENTKVSMRAVDQDTQSVMSDLYCNGRSKGN